MAQVMGDKGYVYGLNGKKNLTNLSIKNLEKNHGEMVDSGKIVLMTGDLKTGLPEYGPFDVIHVSSATERLPRALFK